MSNNEKQIDYNAMSQDEFANQMREKLLNDTEVLSHEQIKDLDKVIHTDGVARRCALAVLTKSYKDLEKSVLEDKDLALAMAEVSECLNADLYRQTADLIDKAKINIMFALAMREDMTSLFEEVKENA